MDNRPGPKKHVSLRRALLGVQVAILAGVVYFVWDRADSLFADFHAEDIQGREEWLVLSGGLYAAFYGLVAWHWHLVCRVIDPRATGRSWLSVFAAQPYKYLPSSLFTFSFRAKYAHDLGLPLKQSTQAQVIENFNLVVTALVLSGLVFLVDRDLTLGILSLTVLIAAVAAGLAARKTVRIPKLPALSTSREMGLLFLCAAAWIVAGLAFWASLVAVHAEVAIPLAIAVSALAFAASLLAVFAPGGLGIREAVFAANGIAVPAIVLWRLITIVVDVVVGAAGIAAIALRKRRP